MQTIGCTGGVTILLCVPAMDERDDAPDVGLYTHSTFYYLREPYAPSSDTFATHNCFDGLHPSPFNVYTTITHLDQYNKVSKRTQADTLIDDCEAMDSGMPFPRLTCLLRFQATAPLTIILSSHRTISKVQ